MPSLEMLKKLLDEFSEKEAHAREEINVITEQIGELEKRVLASQLKLSTVAGDREKVRMMQTRYGGSTLTTGAQTSPSPAPVESKEKESRSRPGRAERAAAAAAATAAPTPVVAEPTLPEPVSAGIPPAPLNLRASSTRLPAAKPVVSETPAETSSPFLSDPDPIPTAVSTNPFTSAQPQPEQGIQVQAHEQAPLSPGEADANSFPSYSETPAQYSGTTEVNYTSAQPVDLGMQATESSSSPFFRPLAAAEPAVIPQPETILQPFVQAAQDAQQPVAQPVAQQEEPGPQIQDMEEEEPDDTVKSINDALRGLFR